jgi:hypothetical protein
MKPNELPPQLKDFRNFLFMCWLHLNLPEPTDVQYDIAHYLQHGPKRCVVEAFRGIGKSWITSAYVCWLLLMDPDHKILVVSASKERSDAFTTFTMRLIKEMPILAHLIPGKDSRDSKIAFDVGPARAAHAPSVKSVGINGQLTGSRANTIIADDVEVPNNSFTQAMRDKLSEAVKEFDALLSPGGRIIYLGTPQCEMSLYNSLPSRGYPIRVWPARYPDEKQMVNYGENLAPYIIEKLSKGAKVGTSTDPKRFSETDLAERECSYGRGGFALQFMLDTRLSDADRYPLKLADLMVMSCNPEMAPAKPVWAALPELVLNDLPSVGFNGDRFHKPAMLSAEWAEYTGTVMAIDPSGRGTDETTYAIVKFLHGFLYVVAAGGLQGGYDDPTLEKLADLAAKWGVNHIIIESNFGDGMFTKLIQPVVHRKHRCLIEEVRHNTQKEKRIIDTLEPVMMRHKLIFDPQVIKDDLASVQHYPPEKQTQYMLFHQMTRITKDRGSLAKDDRIDVLAMAVAYWVESMARDEDKARDDLIERARQAELSKFMSQFGATDKGLTWTRV